MEPKDWIVFTAIAGLVICLCMTFFRFCLHIEASRKQDVTHMWELLQTVERVTERYSSDFSLAQKHSSERSSEKQRISPLPPTAFTPDTNPLFAGMDGTSPDGKDWSPPNP